MRRSNCCAPLSHEEVLLLLCPVSWGGPTTALPCLMRRPYYCPASWGGPTTTLLWLMTRPLSQLQYLGTGRVASSYAHEGVPLLPCRDKPYTLPSEAALLELSVLPYNLQSEVAQLDYKSLAKLLKCPTLPCHLRRACWCPVLLNENLAGYCCPAYRDS